MSKLNVAIVLGAMLVWNAAAFSQTPQPNPVPGKKSETNPTEPGKGRPGVPVPTPVPPKSTPPGNPTGKTGTPPQTQGLPAPTGESQKEKAAIEQELQKLKADWAANQAQLDAATKGGSKQADPAKVAELQSRNTELKNRAGELQSRLDQLNAKKKGR